MRIDIPAGALSADTAAQRHRARAARPRLPPDPRRHPVRQAGQTDLHTDQDVEGSAPQPLSIASQDKTGVWQMYRKPVRDLTARTVSVETNSGWSVGRREGCLSTRGAIQTNALRSKVRGGPSGPCTAARPPRMRTASSCRCPAPHQRVWLRHSVLNVGRETAV